MPPRPAFLLLLLLLPACSQPAPPSTNPPPAELPAPLRDLDRVVILTIDGLRPEDCLKAPTLARLAREGAFAAPPEGALSVMPSVTYPAHTSIVTGSYPARHGITTNHAPDPTPEGANKGGWRWYAEDVRVPTLWGAAYDAGLRTAIITWPVTVGARATVRMPEYWRAKTPDDTKLLRALATDGVWERVEREHPDFATRYQTSNVLDSATVDAALTVLAQDAPNLMLMHVWQTDEAQHKFGPGTPEAMLALAEADRQVARLLAALEHTKEWPRTVLVVASDHGFVRVDRAVNPGAVLALGGLSEKLWFMASGGSAYFYLRDPSDQAAALSARAFFEEFARDQSHGIARVLGPEDIAALHGDPEAVLAIESVPGVAVARREGTDVLVPYGGGTHGYLPERLEMRATLLMFGPRVTQTTLVGARLIDIAPTLSIWLGLSLPGVDGRPLPIVLR